MRSTDTDKIVSCDALKTAIRGQLQKDIIHIDIGFMNGNSVISIQNQEDLSEIWVDLCKGKKVMLWCNGLNVYSVTRESSHQVWTETKQMRRVVNLKKNGVEKEDATMCTR